MNELEKKLTEIGLTEKQAKVYSVLLEMGIGSASSISDKSEEKRSTTYVVLEELISLGIVALVPNSKKKNYRALHPEILIRRKRLAVNRIENALPEIEAIMRGHGMNEKPQVMFFDGINGIKDVLSHKIKDMKGGEIVGFYATSNKETQEKFNYFKSHNKKLEELNITRRGIAPDDPTLDFYRERDKKEGRRMKILPKDKYSSEVAIEIEKDSIKIYDLNNLQGLVIDNPAIAKTMREIFELVWEKTN